ncbi:MAG: DNA polymerase/3'-5' exonuclease PolX [bacterium]|nr:DNA polymerase/3'-5' exonuclease PolX [bacterium]
MENSEIAAVFRRMGLLLQIQGANPFRVRAYENAAHTVDDATEPMAKLIERGDDLTALEGIGKEMALNIEELVATGRLTKLDQLGSEIPLSLIDIVALPGVGPKKAKRLWQELGIVEVDALGKAAKAGEIAKLAGFGVKSEQQILAGIERRKRYTNRLSLAEVDRQAAPLLEYLRAVPGVRKVEVAGSYRRRRETVGDLDVLAVASRPTELVEAFGAYSKVESVEKAGDTRSTVILESGFQVDLRVVPTKSWGAALVYFTGSKAHNIKLRQRAIERGMRLSEYGVFDESNLEESEEAADPWAGEYFAGKTEKSVYSSLELPWIPPELREDRGEIKAARAGKLPRLLTEKDLRGDLQTHSTWSDGRNSIEEMVLAAIAKGYEYIAITDHSPFLAMTGGLNSRKLRQQWAQIETVQQRYPEIRILRGLEVDILEDGTLDMDDETLDELDIVLVAIHSSFDLPASVQTERVLKALSHPAAHIWAHPLARRLGKRDEIKIDLDQALHCAREHGVAVEDNAHPQRLDLRDVHLLKARELGLRVAIGTDAHAVDQLDLIHYGVEQARRAWLTKKDVLNTLPLSRLLKRLGSG